MSAAKAKKSMKNGSYKESGQPWTTQKKGLRYYEHPTRRHGKKQDRYYAIRFKVASKDYGYGIGWWSDGIPEEIQKVDPSLGPFSPENDHDVPPRKAQKDHGRQGAVSPSTTPVCGFVFIPAATAMQAG
jgi:hypothetical protein